MMINDNNYDNTVDGHDENNNNNNCGQNTRYK